MALTLSVLELGLRIQHGTLLGVPLPRLVYHETYGWTNARDRDVAVRTDEFDVQGHQNHWGMLGREIDIERSPGTIRIVVVGDSLTDAFQVPLSERHTERIESMARAAGVPVEVVNTGVTAFSTDQELLYFERELRAFRPDIVLLFFALANDSVGNVRDSRAPGEVVYKPLFGLKDGRLTDPGPVPNLVGTALNEVPGHPSDPLNDLKRWLYFNFELYRSLSDALYLIRAPRDPQLIQDWRVFGPQDDTLVVRSWEMTEALLRRFNTSVEAAGARFGVVALPDNFQIYPELWTRLLSTYRLAPSQWDPDAPNRQLSAICVRSSLRCLDVTEILRASGEGLYWPKDRHFTSKGNAVVAEAVLRWLQRTDLLH